MAPKTAEALVLELALLKKNINHYTSAVGVMLESIAESSSIAIGTKVRGATKVIDSVREKMLHHDYGAVPAEESELLDLMSNLELNIAVLQQKDRQRDASKHLIRTKAILSSLESKSPTDPSINLFVTSTQRSLNKAIDKWSEMVEHVTPEQEDCFEDTIEKSQTWLDKLIVMNLPSENSSAGSESPPTLEPQQHRKPRFEWSQLPSWCGSSATYRAWRSRLEVVVSLYELSDQEKNGLLQNERCIKNLDLRNQLVSLTFDQQLAKLDGDFDNECKAFQEAIDGIRNRPKPTSIDDYTYMISAMKTCFTKIDNMEENKIADMFKLTVFYRDFMAVFPDSVKPKIQERIHRMKSIEDMNNVIAELDYLKWTMESGSNNTRSSNDNRGSRNNRPQQSNRKKVYAVDSKPDKKCRVTGCSESHPLWRCKEYKKLTPADRHDTAVTLGCCLICLGQGHAASSCDREFSCKVDGCGKKHHQLIHDYVEQKKTVAMVSRRLAETSGYLGVQNVAVDKCNPAVVLWDTGSNSHIVLEDYVMENNLSTVEKHESALSAGGSFKSDSTCEVPLKAANGDIYWITCMVIKKITGDVSSMTPAAVYKEFGVDESLLDNIYEKRLDIIVGMSNPIIFPKELSRTDHAYLYKSKFGKGYIACGSSSPVKPEHRYTFATVRSVTKLAEQFLAAENLGIDPPRRCGRCQKCQECAFYNQQVSYQESLEAAAITENLSYNAEDKKWTITYPKVMIPKDVLSNNYNVAVAAHHKLLKRLDTKGAVDAFHDEIMDGVARQVWRKATDADLKYGGVVNYITLTEAFKETAGCSTPVRVCLDASRRYKGASLNDVVVTGPSKLANQLDILLDFRAKEVGMCLDFRKFYQSVSVSEEDSHLMRIVWSPVKDAEPEIYIGMVNNFGVRPAGPVAGIALNLTSEIFQHLNEEAADIIRRRKYVDDVVCGGKDRQHTVNLEDGIKQISSMGGFEFKPPVRSYDDVDPLKVLGVVWIPRSDMLSVKCDINIHAKVKGARLAPDVDLDVLNLPEEITKRIVWRCAMSPYDPYGLISAIVIQLKLIMRSLAKSAVKRDSWDDKVSSEVAVEFRRACGNLANASRIEFPRCVVPEYYIGFPQLITFVDGSTRAVCATVFIRWKVAEDHFCNFLVCSKSKVAPKTATTVPRMELLSSQLGVRLANTVEKAMDLQFQDNIFLTDSSSVFGMIAAESGSLSTFTGHRVAEVIHGSENARWLWCPTEFNPADLGTRGNARPEDLGPNSPWQRGPEWLSSPENTWPTRADFRGEVPAGELKKVKFTLAVQQDESRSVDKDVNKDESRSVDGDVDLWLKQVHTDTEISSKVMSIMNSFVNDKFEDTSSSVGPEAVCVSNTAWFVLENHSSLQKARNVMRIVLKAVDIWLLKAKKRCVPTPTAKLRTAAHAIIVAQHQNIQKSSVALAKLENLSPEIQKFPVADNKYVEVVVMSSRVPSSTVLGSNEYIKPIVAGNSYLAKLILHRDHQLGHGGARQMVARSRQDYWIVQPWKIAKQLALSCVYCIGQGSKSVQQKMAVLDPVRTQNSPPFSHSALDLAGPFQIADAVKKRVMKKVWVMVVVCRLTGAVNLEIIEDYSSGAFMRAFQIFTNRRGTPSTILSDQGTQITASAKATGNYFDYSTLMNRVAEERDIEWTFAPVGSPHVNGQAERCVQSMKKAMAGVLQSRRLSFGEMLAVLSEVENIINSRPYSQQNCIDPSSGFPISPEMALGPRASYGRLQISIDVTESSLLEKAKSVKLASAQFWKLFSQQVLPNRIRANKWTCTHTNLSPGDVVHISSINTLDSGYRMGIVTAARPGKDGLVRTVQLRTATGHKKEVSVHNLKLIVPVNM